MVSIDFKVFRIENLDRYTPSFGRKDLYRICLIKGSSRLTYNDRQVHFSGNYLFFGNINTPYSWEASSIDQQGYSCYFTHDFLKSAGYLQTLRDLSPFNAAHLPLYKLTNENQLTSITFIFQRMLEVQHSDYANRKDMLRSLINLLMHEAVGLRLSTSEQNRSEGMNSSRRLSTQFLDLLDTQFPVENKNVSLQLKSVFDFAGRLGVHPNYLNRAIKTDTGKTVLKLITERIIAEAKVLLAHTDWTISEISYCLGFKYHSYFDNVFKKVTGLNPKAYRDQILTNWV